ncbi:APC family permease [Nocardia sp. CDC153]|uniref:APC family permease n=1 Tax=Nocardia sp. CDC153 TaxID=3112167 RepID=UPI002DBD7CB2|nr:APC family permease [Nocardia sp. CDC153]MEC3952414.1 APC family permease [Nocardia sp. CDC153]
MSAETRGDQRSLGTPHLVFFVIAAAAPLGFSLGAIPLAIGRGGIALALGFLVTAAIMGVFSVGYVTMAAQLTAPGGLYDFVRAGLGRAVGVGASYVALVIYAVAATGAVGSFSVFAQTAAQDLLGVHTPWWIWASGVTVVMGVLGMRSIDLSARVLGVVIMLEVGVLMLVSAAIVVRGGASGLTLAPLRPSVFLHGNVATMLAVGIAAFAGFEATVIYSGEIRDRARTIRRATAVAIVVMAVVYAFVSWAIVVAYGADAAASVAMSDPTALFFNAAQKYLGTWAEALLETLVVSSLFASILAFHNATARYLAAMGRDRFVPSWFAKATAAGAPGRASLAHTALTAAAVLLTLALGGDPYNDLYVLGSTPAVVGIPVLELLASIAIIAYFLRDRRGHGIVATIVAPTLAALALALVLAAIVDRIDLFTGRTGFVNTLSWTVIPAVLLVGVGTGLALRRGTATADAVPQHP